MHDLHACPVLRGCMGRLVECIIIKLCVLCVIKKVHAKGAEKKIAKKGLQVMNPDDFY
jgi:hypothetical protein